MSAVLARSDIERFRALVAKHFGLRYDDDKFDVLADVLRRRFASTGGDRIGAYLHDLSASNQSSSELRILAEELTVNETFFFRNPDNFRALVERVLPERMSAHKLDRRLRFLSAGCASGEEPYSLAIELLEAWPDLANWSVEIVAVDINPAMLTKASRGRYSSWSLRAASETTRDRYFRPEGRDYVLSPEVRRMVRFEEQNLLADHGVLSGEDGYDAILCRNVIMYFTPEAAREVVRRIERSLRIGGFLFLGYAETLRGLSQDFHLCHTHDTFYYQKRDAPRTAAPPTAPSHRSSTTAEEPLRAIVQDAASWVGAIQKASERIATLASEPASAASVSHLSRRGTVEPVRRWDLGLVFEAIRQERFQDALELLAALPPDADFEPEALLVRAALLTNAGRLAEAEKTCTRLLALDELNAGAHYLMALAGEHAGDTARAIDHDQTAIYLDAGFAMPHLHLGILSRRSGDASTAQRELEQALLLLSREDASRLLLFGGGFSRDALLSFCRAELAAVRGAP